HLRNGKRQITSRIGDGEILDVKWRRTRGTTMADGSVAKIAERRNGPGVAVLVNQTVVRPRVSLNEPNHIPRRQPSHLAFPDHVHDFVTLDCPPRTVKGPESLTGVDPPLDRSVVLLHDIVQIVAGAAATSPDEFLLLLQFLDHLWISGRR